MTACAGGLVLHRRHYSTISDAERRRQWKVRMSGPESALKRQGDCLALHLLHHALRLELLGVGEAAEERPFANLVDIPWVYVLRTGECG